MQSSLLFRAALLGSIVVTAACGNEAATAAPAPSQVEGEPAKAGAAGSDGANGIDGANGANGEVGATGATGATGPQGPQGPQGISGFVKVLGFDENLSVTVVGNNGNTLKTPSSCITASHVAGPNETAIVQLNVFMQRNVGTDGNFFYVNAMVSTNGAVSFTRMNKTYHGDALIAHGSPPYTIGNGQVSITKSMPLVEGKTYIFGAGFGSNDAGVIEMVSCLGTVSIVRTGG